MKITATFILSIFSSFIYAQNMTNQTVKDSSFVINEQFMPVYEGTYKDGKPFSGYFKKTSPGMELFQVDYYEGGQPKYQYSRSLSTENEGLGKRSLNIRSEYKDGKIVDGVVYVQLDGGLTIKALKQGKVTGFTVDLFAMNYYNRIVVEKKGDTIFINNLADQHSSIKMYFHQQVLTSELLARGKVLFYSQQLENATGTLPASRTIYGLRNGNADFYSATKDLVVDAEPFRDHKINAKLFSSLFLPVSTNLEVVLSDLVDKFSKDDALLTIYKSGGGEQDQYSILCHFDTDAKGKIYTGVRWTEGVKPYYEVFKKGVVIKKEAQTLAAFQQTFLVVMEQLSKQ